MTFALDRFDLDTFVAATLAEDLGTGGDITSAAVIPADARFSGVMDSRDAITVAGLPIAEAFFRAPDPEVRIERLVGEGDRVPASPDLVRLEGRARALLPEHGRAAGWGRVGSNGSCQGGARTLKKK